MAATVYIQAVRPPRQPFALDTPAFSFAALATLAARAPVGGTREIAIATFVTARMASDVLSDSGLDAEGRRARAGGGRRWLSTLAIAEPLRKAFNELATATETDAPATARALRRVIEVTAPALDAGSRADLERLAKELEAQLGAGT